MNTGYISQNSNDNEGWRAFSVQYFRYYSSKKLEFLVCCHSYFFFFFLSSLRASSFKSLSRLNVIKLGAEGKQIKTLALYIFQQLLRDSALLKHAFKILRGQYSSLPSKNINGEIQALPHNPFNYPLCLDCACCCNYCILLDLWILWIKLGCKHNPLLLLKFAFTICV